MAQRTAPNTKAMHKRRRAEKHTKHTVTIATAKKTNNNKTGIHIKSVAILLLLLLLDYAFDFGRVCEIG